MDSLLPCPFCGSTNLEETALRIQCLDCAGSGPVVGGPEGRVTAWNRRQPPPVEVTGPTARDVAHDAICKGQSQPHCLLGVRETPPPGVHGELCSVLTAAIESYPWGRATSPGTAPTTEGGR